MDRAASRRMRVGGSSPPLVKFDQSEISPRLAYSLDRAFAAGWFDSGSLTEIVVKDAVRTRDQA